MTLTQTEFSNFQIIKIRNNVDADDDIDVR